MYGAGFPGGEVVEADAVGGDEPQPVPGILAQAHRKAVQDVAGRVFELLEMQAVIHADPFARAKPDETVAVLEDVADGIVGQAVVRAEIAERDRLGEKGKDGRYEDRQDDEFFHAAFFGFARY